LELALLALLARLRLRLLLRLLGRLRLPIGQVPVGVGRGAVQGSETPRGERAGGVAHAVSFHWRITATVPAPRPTALVTGWARGWPGSLLPAGCLTLLDMTTRPLHLGLDIDGVIAGYVAAHVAAAPDRVGVTIGADGGDPPTYDMVGEGWYDSTNQWRVVHNIILADPTTFDMTDPTAPEAIAALVDAGHRVDLATARHAPTGVDYNDDLIAELTERWARSH